MKGIIIDINENHDINIILDLMKVHTPRDCWCILVGDIDSISIAQQFIERGILYLHIQSQLADLTQNLLKGIQIESDRKAFLSVYWVAGDRHDITQLPTGACDHPNKNRLPCYYKAIKARKISI